MASGPLPSIHISDPPSNKTRRRAASRANANPTRDRDRERDIRPAIQLGQPDGPFSFDVEHSSIDSPLDFSHSHDEALLRRSPSPRQSPNPNRLSAASPTASNFLRPPGMDDTPADTPADTGDTGSTGSNPFNFQTQFISTSPVKSSVGMRRGHRYKHSSISAQHQIFQEPPKRPPPVLPASLPVPTVREAWASMHRGQRARFYWCLCHAAVASLVFWCASDSGDSLAMTALSHLVFFDVGSAAVCVAVDVLGNFEVWRRSTIRHPFGLRRAEVLAGFAMSIFLVFGGFDLLSHDVKDCLESHHADHHHAHPRHIHPGTIDVPAAAAFISTFVSAYGLGNHARIRRSLMLLHGVRPFSRAGVAARGWLRPLLARVGLATLLANPFHFLTMGVALVLLVLPLMFVAVQAWLDRLLCALIALSMLLLGARLAVAQGLMLLMSYSGRDTDTLETSATAPVVDEIAAAAEIARVEDAQFWQVHYGLCMANIRVRIAQGFDDDAALRAVRTRISRIVQNRLGEGYGRGNSLRWEVTVQTRLGDN